MTRISVRFLLVMSYLLPLPLAACEGICKVNVGDLIKSPDSYDEKEVSVRGVLKIDDLGNLYIFAGTPPEEFDMKTDYLDLVFQRGEDHVTREMDLQCVEVDALFRRYSKNFLGMGWMTSKTGLLKGNSISLCKK